MSNGAYIECQCSETTAFSWQQCRWARKSYDEGRIALEEFDMHEIIITVRSSLALHCIALRYCSILAYPSDRPDDVRQVASGLRDAGVSRSPQRDWTLETKTCMERCSRRIALHST